MQNMNTPITPDLGNGTRAVSVYGSGDALDDFPVLKAFQQYIDAEQAKARKRLLTLGIFFGVLMFVVIAIFVLMLMNVSSRNQQLNDRLIEFAMKDRGTGSAVVVQPPQDSAAVLAFTSKIEEMQRKLAETQAKADKAVAEAEAKRAAAEAEAARPKAPTAEEQEIRKLKAQLAAEREKAEAERKRRHEAELEAYRRKHYPELYEPKRPAVEEGRKAPSHATQPPSLPEHDAIDQILADLDRLEDKESDDNDTPASTETPGALTPVSYFESDDPPPTASRRRAPPPKTIKEIKEPTQTREIPVSRDGTGLTWGIPD